jgi:CubicO group peptidase (beta-lactamase class C family)
MKDPIANNGQKVRSLFGPSASAFGQPGAGGSLGFADPKNDVAFAYVMNQMEPGLFPNPKSLRLVRLMYGEEF